MVTVALYKGFSLHNYKINQTTKQSDLELVKRNILTHIFTKRGERVMMSDFGTSIPDLIFEPLTMEVVELIKSELESVCNYDPRVKLIKMNVTPLWDASVIVAEIALRYIELNVVDTLKVTLKFED